MARFYKKTWFWYLAVSVLLLAAAAIIGGTQFVKYRNQLKSGEITKEEFLNKFFVETEPNIDVEKYFKSPNSDEVKALVGSAPFLGSKDAKVKIVAFEDFYCPICQKEFLEIKKLTGHYGDRIMFVFRQFPAKGELNAARASFCADDLGLFWPFYDLVFVDPSDLSDEALANRAASLGVVEDDFLECLQSDKYDKKINADSATGTFYDVSGTPTFFINGLRVGGEVSFEQFQSIIDYLLDYYQKNSSS